MSIERVSPAVTLIVLPDEPDADVDDKSVRCVCIRQHFRVGNRDFFMRPDDLTALARHWLAREQQKGGTAG